MICSIIPFTGYLYVQFERPFVGHTGAFSKQSKWYTIYGIFRLIKTTTYSMNKDPEQCEHKQQEITVIILHCQECDLTRPIRLAQGEFATRFQQVRQGLLDAGTVLGNSELTDLQGELIRAIQPCLHPKEQRRSCRCGEEYRELCDACGRRFGFENQWILR